MLSMRAMEARTADILTAAIREYIESGQPVSSGELYRKYGFRVKPATIRNELAALEEGGYLMQPHTSSGRVPTDKGYRFLVDAILDEFGGALTVNIRKVEPLTEELLGGDVSGLVHDLSEALNLLGVGFVSRGAPVKRGLDDLVSNLLGSQDLVNLREVEEVVHDFEEIDERVGELLDFLGGERAPHVFIGKSPITRSPHLSVIADHFQTDRGVVVVAAVGPKRMDYRENLRFFMGLRRAMEE
jgi:transcriptional regulator of heat shock response